MSEAARRLNNMCVVMAVVMAVIASSYLALALIDETVAEGWWAPYAVVECLLSLWNLCVYAEKRGLRERR